MGKFIFGIILVVLGLVAYFVRDKFSTQSSERDPTTRQYTKIPVPGLWGKITFGVLGVIGLILVLLSLLVSVGAREVGIPVSFGSVGKDLQAGIHLKAPWTSVTKCSLAEQQSIQNQDAKSGDQAYDQSIPISGSDQGGATADVTFYYHINKQDATLIYRTYACNEVTIQEKLVAQRVRSDVGSAATGFPSVNLKSNRAAIEAIAETRLAADLTPFGITADGVTIGDLILADNVQTAANNKLAAQQNAQTAQFHLQQAQIDKQTAVVTAEGVAAANASQQKALTPQILCQQYIAAISNGHVAVVNSDGPCAAIGGTPAKASAASASTPVIIQTNP